MISFILTDNKYKRLWEIIGQDGYLTKSQFREALKQSQKEDRDLTEVLMENYEEQQEKLLQSFSQYFKLPPVILSKKVIAPPVLNLIPKEVAEQHSVIVFKKIKKIIHIAIVDPNNKQTIEFIKKKTGFKPKVFVTSPQEINYALRKYKSEIREEFSKIIDESLKETLAIHDTAEKMAQYVPIIKIVDTILERAIGQNASDIHFEPSQDKVAIRFRIDGLLNKIVELPSAILLPLTARIKIMANIKIDEHRLPQNGRFKFNFNDRGIDMRVSTIPTLHGTKTVLRILDPMKKKFTLKNLGFNERDFVTLKKEIVKPHGMILVTGPTGSGKTTSLYTILRMLNKENVNICTIEDPIEYGVEGINQTQTNPLAGLNFADGLKSLLRQDPDIIMVGEIRDIETANIAVNAAMTGQIVLSTLHTSNASLAIQRLIEMGVQSFLAATVINLIIGQRLVRRVCPHCKSKSHITEKVIDEYRPFFDIKKIVLKLKKLNLLPQEQSLSDITFSRNIGCFKCNRTGYKGRIGIYEILKIDKKLYQAILKDSKAESIKKEAQRQNFLTMTEDGVLKVLKGQTTFKELIRVTRE